MSQVAARLERLPFCSFHIKLLIIGGLGFTFEAMDAAIMAFILPVVRTQWQLTSFETGLLGSSTYIGFLVGAFIAGVLGDRFGRRVVMMWALFIFCGLSLVNAFVNDWHTFFVIRALAGVGLGAEGAIIAPFLAEFVSNRYRGSFTGALAGFFSFGFVAAAIIGYFVIPQSPEGWRYALGMTAAPVVILLWWRRALMESPRWLESQGRHDEALQVVDRIEASVMRAGVKLPPVVHVADAPVAKAPAQSAWESVKTLWRPPLTRITAMTWVLWLAITFCSYAFFTWIPGLLVQQGLTINKSFSYSIAIYLAQIPGYYSAAYFNEKIGRKATIVTYMFLACLSAIFLAFFSKDPTTILVASVLLSFSMNGVNAGQYAYTPEIYPTSVRATGMGAASSFGRIGAIASPALVGYIYPILGFSGVFGMTTMVMLVGALTVLIFGIQTKGRTLEQIAANEYATLPDGDVGGHAGPQASAR
ncbi:MFS transporter [Cupriavidus sp. AcVe19-6a]|uniref:MFS transporter n=1 Tax=Cupriavidus sp. AcVe19-6a TaxID=2821358 RepID=UPI001AE58AE5|nr:MFS transporter [Cupriavidus sp. AcVe19-6a]MBP0639736.1 MFS transporter [Cupriavidus sp. AcVe19-6a]